MTLKNKNQAVWSMKLVPDWPPKSGFSTKLGPDLTLKTVKQILFQNGRHHN